MIDQRDAFDPMLGGWFPAGAEERLAATTAHARAVRALLLELRAEARGLDLEEAPMRGLARLAVLSGAVEERGAAVAVLGAFRALDLAEVVEALADRRTEHLADRFLSHVGGVRGLGQRTRELRRALEKQARELRRERVREARAGGELYSPPAGLDAYVIPPGWDCGRSGIARLEERRDGDLARVPVAYRPLFVVGAARNRTTGARYVDLCWPAPDSGEEVRRTVPREVIADRRSLVGLSSQGAPVTSGNAGELVAFLAACEAVNADRLLARVLVEGMGWAALGGTGRAFVLGREVIGPASGAVEVRPMEGAEDVLDGWRARGDAADWRAAVSGVMDYPVPGVLYLAALASPLLPIIGCPPFVVDLAGETSHGKSTALRLAASVWGDPRDGRGVFHTWDGTEVGIERLAATVGCLPLLLDEAKRSGGARARSVPRILYALASGQGRRRGKPGGLRAVHRWQALAISTGEAPITERSEDAGTRGRVLSLVALPFGGASPKGAQLTRGLVSAVERSYGHAGRRLAGWLTEAADPGGLRARWEEERDRFGSGFSGGVEARLAGYGAAILLAGRVAQDLKLPCPNLAAVEGVLAEAIRRGAQEADRPRAALVALLSWLGSQPGRVAGLAAGGGDPPGGWLGLCEEGSRWVAVSDPARVYLGRLGFDVPGVARGWAARSWLGSRGHTASIRLPGGGRPRCFVFPWTVCESLLDGEQGA